MLEEYLSCNKTATASRQLRDRAPWTRNHIVNTGSKIAALLVREALIDSAREEEDISDADSDYLDLQSDIAKLKDTVRKFRQEQRNQSSEEEDAATIQQGRQVRGKGRGKARSIFRGPRKAAEPTGDIRARLGRASQCFIEEQYEEAKALVEEVIRINAETYEAWTLLASIFRELGDTEKTLLALIYAAHLRPKDAAQWLSVARFALEETGENRTKNLPSAKFCFSSAIRANPKDDFEARCGKAAVLRELGHSTAAIAEYKHILKQRPHDTSILRLIAEAYIDIDKVEPAQDLYREAIAFYKDSVETPGTEFTWSDANIYVELYAYAGQYSMAIHELRCIARWLLGRESETFWDTFPNDDREWDSTDDRRLLTADFDPAQFSSSQYGDGLPLEFRVKLGQYRLKKGDRSEALVTFVAAPILKRSLTTCRLILTGLIRRIRLQKTASSIIQIFTVMQLTASNKPNCTRKL